MTGDAPHILVVDDDDRLRELLRRFLADNGFFVVTARDAAEARARLDAFEVDLIVLDVMMPGESGLELTRALRAGQRIPVLLLTARGEAEDRIEGLEAGADDYLSKPFEPRELLLRIANILRRRPSPPPSGAVRLGRWTFRLDREELRDGDDAIRLTTAEASLLRALAASPDVVLSREELTRRSRIAGNDRAIDVQVTRLRRKIEDDPRLPRYLHTIRGEGYVLRPDPPDAR